jgi:hypothetical protein
MVKIGVTTSHSGTVTARVEAGALAYEWSYVAPEISLDRAADALLVASLLPSMHLGGTLTSDHPVSPRLLASISRIEDVYWSWRRDPGYELSARVPVDAPQRLTAPMRQGRGVACFFTAGVDSFYTVLRHRQEIDALVYVRGFDVKLDSGPLHDRIVDGVRTAAYELGLPLVVVTTDIRTFSDQFARWEYYHGAALASVAHMLAPHFSKVYIPATQTYAYLTPLGSHPLLDPLWSSEDLELVHDGCEASRLDKLELVTDEPAARHWLRVCWENRGGSYNCGQCEKCLRTMVAMNALGVLTSYRGFPHSVSPVDVMLVRLPDAPHTWEASLAMLEATGRDPIVARALRRRLYSPAIRALHRAVYYARRARALVTYR